MKMKFFLACIIALTIVGTTLTTNAADFTAKWIKSNCASEVAGTPFCYGYVSGVIDAIALSNNYAAKNSGKPFVCPPSIDINYKQFINIVLNYIVLNPNVLEDNAADVILIAMLKAFPCTHK